MTGRRGPVLATKRERTARAEFCPSCRRVVMVGLSADFGGYVVAADPQPMTAFGEAVALMSGRGTVGLRWRYDHYELEDRSSFRIRGSPAGTNGLDVLVVHECDRDYGGLIPNTVTHLRRDSGPSILPENPPY